MRNKFGEQLERLHVEMIQMGALCEDAISAAAQALMKGDEDSGPGGGGRRAGDRPEGAGGGEPLPEAAAAAAACGQGPAGDLLCPEDDLRPGADRRPGGGHRGADPVRAPAGGTRPPADRGDVQGRHPHGDGQRGLLRQAGSGAGPGGLPGGRPGGRPVQPGEEGADRA